MNTLSEFLYSPLLDFIHSNSPSNKLNGPTSWNAIRNSIRSDIQLLYRRVTNGLGDDKHQQDQGITLANASNISCHSTCSGIPLTTPLRQALLLQLQKVI